MDQDQRLPGTPEGLRKGRWRAPADPALVDRIAAILKTYKDVGTRPDDDVSTQAARIIHFGTGVRWRNHVARAERQLAELTNLVRPLRKFLEDKRSLGRAALNHLEEAGLLRAGWKLEDLVDLLKRAELVQPHGGRPSDKQSHVIAELTAGAVEILGERISYANEDNKKVGAFPDLLRALFEELLKGTGQPPSTETALRYVLAKRKAQRGEA